jgi:hypothetical protein
MKYEESDRMLESRVTEWLAEVAEHWPVFCAVILNA